MIVRTYLSIDDIYHRDPISNDVDIENFFKEAGIPQAAQYFPELRDQKIKNFFDIIYRYYNESSVAFIDKFILYFGEDGDPTTQEIYDEMEHFAHKFYNWLKSTYENYFTKIDLFEQNKNLLFDAPSSKTKTVYNDTPQDESESVVEGEGYASNVNITTQELEYDSLLRMDEINNRLLDLYDQWRIEFEHAFVIRQ